MKLLWTTVVAASLLAAETLAWGQDGHKIVATIAQIHLHPQAKNRICNILPKNSNCHLAPQAAWADTIRGKYPETGPMHYINGVNDDPPDYCSFGQGGWANDKVNVVTAIHEKTQALMAGSGNSQDDEDLRFLVHFMGDLHQPLHLTGKLKGGNGAWVKWFGRSQKLHSVWDSSILNEKIATLGNYTSSTGIKQIESNLRGDRFDPYVRFIVKEGVMGWWRQDSSEWIKCPANGDPYPFNNGTILPSSGPAPSSASEDNEGASVKTISTESWNKIRQLRDAIVSRLPATIRGPLIAREYAQPVVSSSFYTPSLAARTSWTPACPYSWGKELQPINCKYAWPAGFRENGPLIELDEGNYLPKIRDDKVFESLFAHAGLRLAAILNYIYAGSDGLGSGEPRPFFQGN